MAITRSAKKAIRAGAKKRIFNIRRREAIAKTLKAFQKAVAAKDAETAEQLLPAVYQAIDKALKRGVLKANTAARKKALLARTLKRSRV